MRRMVRLGRDFHIESVVSSSSPVFGLESRSMMRFIGDTQPWTMQVKNHRLVSETS